MDEERTVASLRELVLRFRDARDWAQFHTPKDLAMGLGIEAAELAELFLWKQPDEIAAMLADARGKGRVADELADVLVYVLYLSSATGIDLSEALTAKMAKNAAKYPVEKARGSAKKYDEL